MSLIESSRISGFAAADALRRGKRSECADGTHPARRDIFNVLRRISDVDATFGLQTHAFEGQLGVAPGLSFFSSPHPRCIRMRRNNQRARIRGVDALKPRATPASRPSLNFAERVCTVRRAPGRQRRLFEFVGFGPEVLGIQLHSSSGSCAAQEVAQPIGRSTRSDFTLGST